MPKTFLYCLSVRVGAALASFALICAISLVTKSLSAVYMSQYALFEALSTPLIAYAIFYYG